MLPGQECLASPPPSPQCADGANIIVTGYTEEEVQYRLNPITSLLIKWVDSNGFALNLKISLYMVFSNHRIW